MWVKSCYLLCADTLSFACLKEESRCFNATEKVRSKKMHDEQLIQVQVQEIDIISNLVYKEDKYLRD